MDARQPPESDSLLQIPRDEMDQWLSELKDGQDGIRKMPPLPLPLLARWFPHFPRDWCSPVLGWPLVLLLWLILGVNLHEIAYTVSPEGFGSAYPWDNPFAWCYLAITNAIPIARAVSVFALLRLRRWGIMLYMMASLFRIAWMVADGVEAYQGTVESFLLLAFVILVFRKRDEFE